jgi:hypothetical protein
MTDQHVACELCSPPEPTTSAASVVVLAEDVPDVAGIVLAGG